MHVQTCSNAKAVILNMCCRLNIVLHVVRCGHEQVLFGVFTRPIDTARGRLVFEHFLHPCLATNTSDIAVSRFLLPFGLQGFEMTVVNIFVISFSHSSSKCRRKMHD